MIMTISTSTISIVLLVMGGIWVKVTCVRKMTEIFSWRTVQYEFNSTEDMEAAKEKGYYVYGNSIVTSIAIYEDKLFLATPRLKSGIPSTLNYVGIEDTDAKSPLLKPYPSWEMNEYYNHTSKQKTMTSIVNVKVDKCDRLWALDTGVVEELGSRKEESSAAIFVFNLKDDKLVRKYNFKEDDASHSAKLANIVVDDGVDRCDKTFAYIADATGGLIVYNWETNQSYRIENNYFHFDPMWGNLKTSRGSIQQINDGLQAMTLTLPRRNGLRELLFHPLISTNEFSVSTSILRNKTLAQENATSFYHLGERGPNSQSSASCMDQETGVMLYTTIINNALVCWNTFWGEDLQPENQGLVDTFEEFSYPADLTVDLNGTVWVLTNRLLDYKYEKKENSIANRLYTGKVRYIIRGTPCAEE